MVQDQVLKARKPNREDLLFSDRREKSSPDPILNIKYHSALARLKSILSKIHSLVTSNTKHDSVIQSIPIVGFRRGKRFSGSLFFSIISTHN